MKCDFDCYVRFLFVESLIEANTFQTWLNSNMDLLQQLYLENSLAAAEGIEPSTNDSTTELRRSSLTQMDCHLYR